MTAFAARLPDGRLHLQHGPIDLIIAAEGRGAACAYKSAIDRFDGLLEGLVSELPLLRRRAGAGDSGTAGAGPVAARMLRAVRPHNALFVTPMAAVAGAVADEVLQAMTRAGDLDKAYVNNGGDIAFHLAGGAEMRVALPGGLGDIRIRAGDHVRGIATSGWRGRSHSLGIADAVTVLARTAAEADVAATLVANAVDLPGHEAIERSPASDLSPDSDLGARLVTTAVGPLGAREISAALEAGCALARDMRARGLIDDAVLTLAGAVRQAGQHVQLERAG